MRRVSAVRAILRGTLIVGVLDILDAFLFFWFRNDVGPVRILQSIAAGAQGRSAFQGGAASAALGALLHFSIAFVIVTTYFVASRWVKILVRRPVICGVVYGVVVFAVMQFIVVPNSATGGPVRWPPWPVLVNGLLIHAFGVGLPSALAARAAR